MKTNLSRRTWSALFFGALLVWAVPVVPPATAAELKAGEDYELVQPPVPSAEGKAEIVEVFNFTCPHCFNLHPSFEEWARKNRERFLVRSLPIFWGNQTDLPLRAYFAATYLGQGEAMQNAIFRLHFEESGDIEKMEELLRLAKSLKLDPGTFQAHMQSFGVTAKVNQAKNQAKEWGVRSTPTLVINGRYRVTPVMSKGDLFRMFQVIEELAQRAP
ncbi:MAG: thiol:disulfide interchange protein DsbA/DsbL [Magnetococcales bacterium]|nr:thiol:disulfide interchange protein DsbA/DsbL [Magnetococcales bacterium]